MVIHSMDYTRVAFDLFICLCVIFSRLRTNNMIHKISFSFVNFLDLLLICYLKLFFVIFVEMNSEVKYL